MANFLIYCLILTIEVSKCSEFKSISFIICIFTILSQESGPLAIRGCLEAKNCQLSYYHQISTIEVSKCSEFKSISVYFDFLQFKDKKVIPWLLEAV